MHFTRPRELLAGGLVGLLIGALLFRFGYSALPRIPVAAGITLALLAVIELVLAFLFRGRIRTGRVTSGIAVARAVALAKASSLLGALMLGGWLGAVIVLAPQTGRVAAAAHDVPSALVGAVCAAVLIGCALWLEYCCRTPDSGDSDRPDDPTG